MSLSCEQETDWATARHRCDTVLGFGACMIDHVSLSAWVAALSGALALVSPLLLGLAAAPILLAVLCRSWLGFTAASLCTCVVLILLGRQGDPEALVLAALAWTGAIVAALTGLRASRARRRETQREATMIRLCGDVEQLLTLRERLLLRSIDAHAQGQEQSESRPRLRLTTGDRAEG